MLELLRGLDNHVCGLLIDGSHVPLDTGNADYQAFIAVHGPLPDGDSRHWIIDGGQVRAMTPAERAAADAERAAQQRQRRLGALVADTRVQFARAMSLKTEGIGGAEAAAADTYHAALLDCLSALLGENPPDPETAAIPAVPAALHDAWRLRYGE